MKKLISVVLAFALITCGIVYYTNENNAYAVPHQTKNSFWQER